jgi:tetratricopeptide (TPR) repeat protein
LQQAVADFQAAYQAAPKSDDGTTALYNSGVTYLQMKQPTQAIAAFKTYLDAMPDGPLADKAAANQGQAAEALADTDTANRATLLQTAMSAYKTAAAKTKDPKIAARAAWRVGVVEARAGQLDQGERDIDAAIAKYGNSDIVDDMAYSKPVLYQDAKKDDLAMAAFKSYLEKYPNGAHAPLVHYNVAVMEYNTALALQDKASKEQDPATTADLTQAKTVNTSAASDFQTALAAQSKDVPEADAYYFMGWAYANSDQPDKAVTAFKALLQKYPNADPKRLHSAMLQTARLEATTNPDDAIQLAKQVLTTSVDPKDQDTIDANLALGEAYSTKQDCTNALAALQKVVDNTTTDRAAEALYYQGQCYKTQGKNSDARLSWLKVKTLYKLATQWVTKADQALQTLPQA